MEFGEESQENRNVVMDMYIRWCIGNNREVFEEWRRDMFSGVGDCVIPQ